MKNTYKFLIIVLLAVFIIPQVALAAWWNPFSWGIWNSIFHFQRTEQQQPQPQKPADETTKPNATANWKTYTNMQYGFELKYPSDWQIQDISYTYNGIKSPAVNILSKPRYDLPNYKDVGAKFLLQLFLSNNKIVVNDNNFIKVHQQGQQSIEEISLGDSFLKGTQEYKLAQPIIQSVKFTNLAIDQTAGWKTYTNTQYGFEFKYPTSLGFIDDSKYQTGKYLFYSHLNTVPTDGTYGVPVFSFSILKESINEYLATLEQSSGWYEGVNPCEDVSSVIDKTENIKLDGLDAKKITLNICKNFGPISLPDKNGIQILTEKDNNLYIIGVSPIIYDRYSGNYYKILDTFISTFKFTTPTDQTANWKTYTNVDAGFSIKYPPSWTYEDWSPSSELGIMNGGVAFCHVRQGLPGCGILAINPPISFSWDNPNSISKDNFQLHNSPDENIYTVMKSTFKFTGQQQNFSSLNMDELLHKLFPSLTFIDGVANLPATNLYDNLKLYLKNSTEDYFASKTEKSLLLTVQLDGVAHAGGLFHSFLGLFDKNGNLLTPSSSFGNGETNYDFHYDKAQFGGDEGNFGFYNCNGIKYIAFISHACPNGSCCSGQVGIFKFSDGIFGKTQAIDSRLLNPLKISFSDNNLIINKVPSQSGYGTNPCPETVYKKLIWDSQKCIFK